MLSKKYIDWWVVGLLFACTFGFLYFTGTLTSGYHFIDDHTLINVHNSLTTGSLPKTMHNYVFNDFAIRFRPLFYVYTVLLVYLFGLNFFGMSLFIGFLGAITLVIFYLGLRKLSFGILPSLLFVALIFVGPQAAIWWRLGTNETIAIFFLGLSFLFLAKCSNGDNYRINNAFFVVFLSLAALSKESFLVAVPAFILLKLGIELGGQITGWRDVLKTNWLSAIPLLITFMGLLVIKFVIGTNKIGYAGVTSTFHDFLHGVRGILLGAESLRFWIVLVILITVVYFVSLLEIPEEWQVGFKSFVRYSLPYFIFIVVLLVPEVILHAKSGMTERYLLPTTVGLALTVVVIWQGITSKYFRAFAGALIVGFLLVSTSGTAKAASSFAVDGKSTNYFFNTVIGNASNRGNILFVAEPVQRFEVTYSIMTYLKAFGRSNLFGYAMPSRAYTPFESDEVEQWHKWLGDKPAGSTAWKPDMIIIFDKIQSDLFFAQAGLPVSDYRSLPMDSEWHAIYVRAR
jgi:hypothetical protein